MQQEKTGFTLREIAEFTRSQLIGEPNYRITGFADLESASRNDISFLSNPRYTNSRYTTAMKETHAGAIFIAPSALSDINKNFLINQDPSKAFQMAVEKLWAGPLRRSFFSEIHPKSVVHQSAQIGKNVTISPNVVVDAKTSIGENTFIGAGAYIGPYTTIGNDCLIHPNVTIRERCQIGNRVVIQSGTVIGSCGFGFATNENGVHERIPQLGVVVLEDDVEIGANSTVDRARFTETRICKGSKLDSLIIIGHNARIGEHNLICGQTAIAGSTKTGRHVVIAGQCGIDGHLYLDDNVIISGKSGVTKSLASGKYGGIPVQPLQEHNKNAVLFRKIAKFVEKIKELARRIDQLEKRR